MELGALDGTKIHADASKHMAMSYGGMMAVNPQVEAELKKIGRLRFGKRSRL